MIRVQNEADNVPIQLENTRIYDASKWSADHLAIFQDDLALPKAYVHGGFGSFHKYLDQQPYVSPAHFRDSVPGAPPAHVLLNQHLPDHVIYDTENLDEVTPFNHERFISSLSPDRPQSNTQKPVTVDTRSMSDHMNQQQKS